MKLYKACEAETMQANKLYMLIKRTMWKPSAMSNILKEGSLMTWLRNTLHDPGHKNTLQPHNFEHSKGAPDNQPRLIIDTQDGHSKKIVKT